MLSGFNYYAPRVPPSAHRVFVADENSLARRAGEEQFFESDSLRVIGVSSGEQHAVESVAMWR